MSVSSFSAKRPVTISMIFIGACLMGMVMYNRLPVELMPNISYRTISVIIQVRGQMPPTEVESMITTLVEDSVSTVTDLEGISSTSEAGKCTVSLRFKSGTDMNFAALEVREKFSKVKNKLPKEIEKPVIAKYEESDAPIIIVAVMGPTEKYTPEDLRKIVEAQMKERIARVPGVANVDIGGGRENKIIADLQQPTMDKYQFPMNAVIDKVGSSNLSLLAGEVRGSRMETKLRTVGQFKDVEEVRNVIVKTTEAGSSVKFKDLGKIKDDYMDPKGHARVNAKPVVTLYIQRESTANTVQVAEAVVKTIEKIKTRLPKDMRLLTVSNQAEFILEAIGKVREALLHGFLLVSLVLYAFLRNFPSTIIISLSIPISMLITFACMQFTGITLNVMTLSGLALGIGMLLDNSIVVLENIFKRRERGEEANVAAVRGADEVVMSIVAATATTIIVFLPLQFVSEQVRMLYGGLAMTITYALLASLFCALALVPMLACRLGQGGGTKASANGPKAMQMLQKSWKGMRNNLHLGDLRKYLPRAKVSGTGDAGGSFGKKFYTAYRHLLAGTLRFRYAVLAGVLVVFGASCLLVTKLDMDLSGSAQQNKFTIFVELPDGARLEMSDKVVKEVEALLNEVKEVKTIQSRVEGWSSKVYVTLVEDKERDRTLNQVVDALRPKVAKIGRGQDSFIYFSAGQESGGKELYIDIYGFDYDILKKLAGAAAKQLNEVDGLADTKIRITEGRPEYRLIVDKDQAALHGLTVKDIADEIHGKVRGLRASTLRTEGREIEIVARLDEKYRKNLLDILRLTIFNRNKEMVYVDQVVHYKPGLGPSEIWRNNKSRMIQVSSTITKLSMGEAIAKATGVMQSLEYPQDYHFEFGGNYERMQKSQRQMYMAFLIAVLLIYMVLASLFESYVQPLIILCSVPLALIGAILALYLTGKPITMGVMVGAIMLAGIVASNAILLIGKVNQLREDGTRLDRSLISAGVSRARPILMTATCTELGLLPMALSKGGAASLWSPLAMTVVGGLISGTVLTLVLIPSIYRIVEDVGRARQKIFSGLRHASPRRTPQRAT